MAYGKTHGIRVFIVFAIFFNVFCACAASPSGYKNCHIEDGHVIKDDKGCMHYNREPVSNESAKWSGECVDGFAHGHGTLKWFKGGVENGWFTGNKRCGKSFGEGVDVRSNGDRYEGEYKDGLCHGKGIFAWANGDWYKGNFVNGSRTGFGTYYWINGSRYEGKVLNGLPTGKGKFFWPDGSQYEGMFAGGVPNGEGLFTWPNYNQCQIDFSKGMRMGKKYLPFPFPKSLNEDHFGKGRFAYTLRAVLGILGGEDSKLTRAIKKRLGSLADEKCPNQIRDLESATKKACQIDCMDGNTFKIAWNEKRKHWYTTDRLKGFLMPGNGWSEKQAAANYLCGCGDYSRYVNSRSESLSEKDQKLLQAAKSGVADVRAALAEGADINAKNANDGATALWYASMMGNTPVVGLLLEKGADVNERKKDGTTALWIASLNGHEDTVKLLLEKGADIDSRRNKDGATVLWGASGGKHDRIVELLLNKGADANTEVHDGETALMNATWKGNARIVRLLLDHGANVNEKMGRDGTTALIKASMFGSAEVIGLLLDRGADANAKKYLNLSSLAFVAERLGFEQFAASVYSSGIDALGRATTHTITPILVLSMEGREEKIRLLVDNGADLNAKLTIQGVDWTALKIAKHMEWTNAAEMLERAGATK